MKLTVDFWIPSLTERCSFVANELGFGSGICLLQWDLHNEAPSRLMQPGNIPGHWHWLLRSVECLAHCTALPLPICTLPNPPQAQFRSLALPSRWFGTIPAAREGWTVWLWTLPCQLGFHGLLCFSSVLAELADRRSRAPILQLMAELRGESELLVAQLLWEVSDRT